MRRDFPRFEVQDLGLHEQGNELIQSAGDVVPVIFALESRPMLVLIAVLLAAAIVVIVVVVVAIFVL
jgi:hypothetical protein